jgi:hypothetical protein
MSATLSELSDPRFTAGSGATKDAYDLTRRRSIIYNCDWDAWLNKLTGELEQEERYLDELKYREGVRNQLYYEGNFFFRISEETGEVRDLPHTDADPFFPHNWFRYFTDLSVAASLEASPDIVIDPTRNDDHNIHAARAARDLGDYLERELITEEFRLETEKTRQLYGGVWWYSYPSTDAHKLFVERPKYEQRQQTQGGDAFICACGDMGPTERLYPSALGSVCPSCMRNSQMQILHAPDVMIDEIIEMEKVPLGFPCVECVSPLQMKGDRRGHYLKGQYLRRKRLVDRDVIAEKIWWWDEKRSGNAGGDDPGIRAEEISRRSYSNSASPMSISSLGGYDRGRTDVVVEQWWLQPSKYAHVQFDRDVEFIGEECTPIPAYTPLGKVFPKGLYALKVGGQWLDHGEQNFKKSWVYIPYIYEPNKADGGSLKDMCEPQREIIHMRSLLYLYLLARSGGAPTIIRPPLSETDFDGSPATITRMPAGFTGDLQELFFQPQFPPADPNLSSYPNQMVGEMQIMSQTVSPTTTGDPNAQEMGGTSTARGMMIMNAKAQGLQGPKLMPLAFAQASAVTQWIEIFREILGDDEVPIPLKGKTGSPEWRMLKASDLEGDFLAYPRAGSWIPRPREEQQAALQNAFTVFGPVLLDPNAPQDLKRKIIEVYGLEIDLDDYNMEARDAMLRIDQMKELLPHAIQLAQQLEAQGMIPPDQETGEPPDPTQIVGQILASMLPPDEDLDDPTIFMKYDKDWLRSDQGREANPMLQSAIRTQFKMYKSMIDAAEQAQMKQMQDMQPKQPSEEEKAQAQSQLEQQRHHNRMQQQEAMADAQHSKSTFDTDNRIKEQIAKAALEAALSEGRPLPVTGKQSVPALGGLPSQPAM